MDHLKLLKSLRLLASIPEEKLATLSDFLLPTPFKDGETIFEEGTKGESLFFISEGHVRIAKRLPSKDKPAYKDLAILAPGDCFGEMSLMEEDADRSANAIASGECVLLRLSRQDLHRWLKSDPVLATAFFSQLVKVLAGYLRRSSNELTLLFDLSQILLEPFPNPRDLLVRVLDCLLSHMEGDWSAGAYVYNEFNDEMDLAAAEGDFASVPEELKTAAPAAASSWLDDRTYRVVFPGKKRATGFFLFRRAAALAAEEKNEVTRTLTTTARLITTAIENIAFRTEETLRARLNTSRSQGKF
ncbi:MAG: cyclic nucleotide-binding domain-containing protein [Elusimicrobiota bacterium]